MKRGVFVLGRQPKLYGPISNQAGMLYQCPCYKSMNHKYDLETIILR